MLCHSILTVATCRGRDGGRPPNLHPIAHGEAVVEQGFGSLCSPPLYYGALIWKEGGDGAFLWRAPHHRKGFCLITLLALGLQGILDPGVIYTSPVVPTPLTESWAYHPLRQGREE